MIRLCKDHVKYMEISKAARKTAEDEYSQTILGARLASILRDKLKIV